MGNLSLIVASLRGTVVDAEPPRAVRLTNEERQRGEGRRTGADDPLAQHLVALPLQLVLLRVRVAVGLDSYGTDAPLETKAVAEVTARWKSL